MGIPSYFSYIVRNHSNIIKKLSASTIQVNNVYLDCNSIIYDVVHGINFAELDVSEVDAILSRVCLKIDEYIDVLKPSHTIFIAFDGVAPVAKLEQQRSRRYKSLYQNKIMANIYGKGKDDSWNTTAITPGTKFMARLNKHIRNVYGKKSAMKRLNVENIIISPSDIYGEGEHKLFRYIREHKEKHSTQTTIIYGLDADLIMLCMNHLPISPNIYLFRETPHFIKSINSDLEPNENYLLDIPLLTNIIVSDMNNGDNLSVENECININDCGQNSVYDYIFICFMLGNDFMPHFPALNIRTGGIHKLLLGYKHILGNKQNGITNGKNINWNNFRKLIEYLASNEHKYLLNEHKKRDKFGKYKLSNETADDKYKLFESQPTYSREKEKYINPFKVNWEYRYYEMLFDIKDIDEEMMEKICINYLEGLEWTMKYYTNGCIDWRWKYEYNYPPLLKDLLKYIPSQNHVYFTKEQNNPVNERVQLSYVLPFEKLDLLPKMISKKLLKEKPEWYDNDCLFEWSYCRYFWESHVILPEININELETIVM